MLGKKLVLAGGRSDDDLCFCRTLHEDIQVLLRAGLADKEPSDPKNITRSSSGAGFSCQER